MSIATKIQTIKGIKEDIRQAIESKNVACPVGTPFGQYASKIGEISEQGGVLQLDSDGHYSGEIYVPNIVTKIGDSMFASCENLTMVEMHNGVTQIGQNAFRGCTSLVKVELFNGLTIIGDSSFYMCTSLESITLPDSLQAIYGAAFYGCESLAGIYIPRQAQISGPSTFARCIGLEDIVVDEDNPYVDSRDNCNAIIQTDANTLLSGCKNTIIPDSVTVIGEGAFQGISTLTSITIPSGVAVILPNAFIQTGLTSITLPDTIEIIDQSSFASLGLELTCLATTPPRYHADIMSDFSHVYVPSDSVDAYKSAPGWSVYASVIESI